MIKNMMNILHIYIFKKEIQDQICHDSVIIMYAISVIPKGSSITTNMYRKKGIKHDHAAAAKNNILK